MELAVDGSLPFAFPLFPFAFPEIQVRKGGAWSTVATVRNARSNTVRVEFPQVVQGDALRVFVPAADLPRSTDPGTEGIVRICELLLVLPDESETNVLDWLGKP